MTLADLLQEQNETLQKLGEREAQLAGLTGKLEGALLATFSEDVILINNLRAREWLRHDPTLVLQRKGDAITGHPDDWPPSVDDPTKFVGDFISERVTDGLSTLGVQPPGNAPPEKFDSPSVRKLREMLA